MTKLEGRTCLITGAAGGLGRSMALAAAARGADLVLTDLDADGLSRTADEVRDAGGTVRFAEPADVTDRDAVDDLARRALAATGGVDVVMNVAGVSVWGSVDRLEHRHWRRMIDVNLMGPVHVIEAFVPPMIAAGRGGHLVNVSSAAGLFGLPWHAAYSASKFGLRGVSEVLRFDLRRHRIGVSLVCPGAVDTPLVQSVDLVGIDRDTPTARRMVRLFSRHAVSPDRAARTVLRGVERDRYLIFTSADIRIGHLAQRLCPPLYEAAMHAMNRAFVLAVRRSARHG
ncbi:SDR family oxidoreductase [Actinomadura sp. WMMB 499]|uniref:SDR family oxidoreductase n=1 Tax=Actinomadura sp. WMMB 499 TaxID=1219491 RepID=UPI001244824E|nr:SDR family oxidoreductase [Actinomadura sp. WMMB 499]QFG25225.1 SDR family oxidoreductase [Actinomadura sp. WMMB 499]